MGEKKNDCVCVCVCVCLITLGVLLLFNENSSCGLCTSLLRSVSFFFFCRCVLKMDHHCPWFVNWLLKNAYFQFNVNHFDAFY